MPPLLPHRIIKPKWPLQYEKRSKCINPYRRCMHAAFVLSCLNVPALSNVDALAGLVCAASWRPLQAFSHFTTVQLLLWAC